MPTPEVLNFNPEAGPYSDQDIENTAKDAIRSKLLNSQRFRDMTPEQQNTTVDKLFYGNFADYIQQARDQWKATQGQGQPEQTETRKAA